MAAITYSDRVILPPELSCCQVWKSIECTPFIQQTILNNNLLGEFNAPLQTSPTRICTIDVRGAIITIKSLYCNDGELYADYVFISEDMHKLIERGEAYLKARVYVTYSDNSIQDIRFVTVDLVQRR